MKKIAVVCALMLPTVVFAAGGEQARDTQNRGNQKPSPTPADVLRTYDERHPERVPLPFTVMRLGTWNTMLQPWMPYRADVVKTIARTNLDLLFLQEVWTEEARDAIVNHPLVKAKYRYHYVPPVFQLPGTCPGIVPQIDQENYISCLIQAGIDTRTLEQPIAPIPETCQQLGLNILLASQHCKQCLDNTMQGLASEPPAPYAAINACTAGQGVRYAHGGNTGMLVLSKRPLTDVQIIDYTTYLIKRITVWATVSGVRIAFTHFPHNVLEDINPILAPFQSGALQNTFALDVIDSGATVSLGDFNSGPNYQPVGYDLLVNAGYKPLFSRDTHCPDTTHGGFAPCQVEQAGGGPGPRAIDNIFVMENSGACLKAPFAAEPVSDHIGLAALCVLKKQ